MESRWILETVYRYAKNWGYFHFAKIDFFCRGNLIVKIFFHSDVLGLIEKPLLTEGRKGQKKFSFLYKLFLLPLQRWLHFIHFMSNKTYQKSQKIIFCQFLSCLILSILECSCLCCSLTFAILFCSSFYSWQKIN